MSDDPQEKKTEKKIIVDEDWKSQVEAEREAADQKAAEQEAAAEDSAEPSAATEPPADAEPPSRGPLPPPNLTFLASSLYLQGMISLGMLPNPATDEPQVDLDQAKHAIDTLQVLQEKTEGNRTPQETAEMETMLHELRLGYISQGRTATPATGGE